MWPPKFGGPDKGEQDHEMNHTLTAVPGIAVGHATDTTAWTGCTVVLCEAGAVGGVEVRGGAAGTHGTDTLRVFNFVETVHAIVLAGGSAFGLASIAGVMQFLEERGIGLDVGVARVPIVAGAVIFDLSLGDARVRPTALMGRAACEAAQPAPPAQGNVGAGTGATVGKLFGLAHAMKGGFGTAGEELAGGIIVGACAVVNAFGDVVDPCTDRILAGARDPQTGTLANTAARMKKGQISPAFARPASPQRGNPVPPLESTTLGVIATNACLTKMQANKVAQMAHQGLARAIRPVHTFFDGDTVFVLATGDVAGDANTIGLAAGDALAAAIVNAVRSAHTVGPVIGLAGETT